MTWRFEVCSPVETRLWMPLRRAGVPEASHSSTQIPREGPGAAWPDLQWEHDQDRNSATRRLGGTQLVFSTTRIMQQPQAVVAEIAAELRSAGLTW